jgi:tetratricopeptide (TPR) repeat protein
MYGRRVFWVPREFGEWTHSWRDLSLTLHGLCYEVLAEPAISTTDPVFTFPGPDQYSTSRFRDPETRDLCLRFAATANRRGMLRHEAGNTDAALTDFDLALAYFPEYGAAVENKGLVHAISGEPDSARVYLVRYLELEPNSPEVPKVKSVLAGLRHP